MSDAINPDHYKRLPAEAIEIIEAMIAGAPDNKAAYLHGQAAKYDLRLWGKGKSLEDFLSDWGKHIWYALRLESHLLELIEKQKADEQQKEADFQSLKDHPFGKLKEPAWTPKLGDWVRIKKPSSDKIPDGYRKLNDSSIEPRQRGDLRWSIAEKRYIEIGFDEIGYANRENWAACRKITGEGTGEVTGEVEPPDGWRFLEVGEVIRKGDRYFKNQEWHSYDLWVGAKITPSDRPSIRRNKFEVGEKVVHGDSKSLSISVVGSILGDGWLDLIPDGFSAAYDGFTTAYHVKDLAPYIEETT